MRRRFRRFNGVWLATDQTATWQDIAVTAAGAQDTVNLLIGGGPATLQTIGATYTTTGGMWSSLQQGLTIVRVVGKLFVGWVNNDASDDRWVSAVVKAGIFVDQVDNLGNPQNSISGGPASARRNMYSDDNSRLRWIWRRSWVIGEGGLGDPTNGLNGVTYPPGGNWAYGSLGDGPNLDTRGSKASLKIEESLFLTVQVQPLELAGESPIDGKVRYFTDLRVLGKPNRRMAQR